MGDNTEDTLASTDISNGDRSRYVVVVAKFDAFSQVYMEEHDSQTHTVQPAQPRRRRVSRAIHHQSQQFGGQLCLYSDVKDDLIWGLTVVGVSNKVLSKHLQLDPELTLEKAKKIFWQHEALQE